MPGLQAYTSADLARLRSVAVRSRGFSHRVKDQVRESRDQRGRPVKVTRDQLGNLVRERWEGQDVHVFLPHLRILGGIGGEVREVRA